MEQLIRIDIFTKQKTCATWTKHIFKIEKSFCHFCMFILPQYIHYVKFVAENMECSLVLHLIIYFFNWSLLLVGLYLKTVTISKN